MKNTNVYRHGDVDIIAIEKLPEGLKKLNHGTLALGEATGHHHSLVMEKINTFDLLEDAKGNKYLFVVSPTPLTHQEHKTIVIEPGAYQIKMENEYDYFLENVRHVQD